MTPRIDHAVRWAREAGRWVWDFQPCGGVRSYITKPEEVDVVDCPTCKAAFERPYGDGDGRRTAWHVKWHVNKKDVTDYTVPAVLEEVTVLASGTNLVTSPLVAKGHVAKAHCAPGGKLVFLADVAPGDYGMVHIRALTRDGAMMSGWYCDACGAAENAKHPAGEMCPGLQKMRTRFKDEYGVRGIEVLSQSAAENAKGFQLRPPPRDVVVLADDQSEPP